MLPGRLRLPESFLEMDRTENALRDELTQPRYPVIAGRVTVPDAPGLGVEVDLLRLADFSGPAK